MLAKLLCSFIFLKFKKTYPQNLKSYYISLKLSVFKFENIINIDLKMLFMIQKPEFLEILFKINRYF